MTRKIERLVESTYRNLAPRAGIEEELRDNLAEDQRRPRRLPLVPIAALLLIGAAFVIGHFRGNHDEQEGTTLANPADSLTMATVSQPPTGTVPKGKNEFHVRLVHGSRMQVVVNSEWRDVSMDELGGYLRHVKDDAWIVLTVDRNAPWQHVQWLMLICAEEKLPKLALAVQNPDGREFRLDATLPTDLGVGDQRHVVMRVSVKPAALKETRWGVQTVRMPSAVRYAFGDREADELASVARWIGQAKAAVPADGTRVRAELKASPRAPFESVAKVLAEFRQAGYRKVDFYGTKIPDKDLRAARVLPYPAGWPLAQKPDPISKKGRRRLTFALAEGDAKDLEHACDIVAQRLERAGLPGCVTELESNGLSVTLPADADADEATVQQIVERKGATLVLHLTVEPGDAEYDKQWKRFQESGEAGAGYRWYPLGEQGKKTFPAGRLPEGKQPYVLCQLDDCDITGASLENVRYRRESGGLGKAWAVMFDVRKEHRANMERLTNEEGRFLAIILDGKVHSAPVLLSKLSGSGQITGGFDEAKARTLAATLGSEALPVRLKLGPEGTRGR